MLDVLQIFCQLACDAPLLLSTSLQLANREKRERRRPPPNLGTLNIPLDPCQDSQAAARRFQLHFPQPPASIMACLTLGGAPKPLPTPLEHKLNKEEGVTQPKTSQTATVHGTLGLRRPKTSFTQKPCVWHNNEHKFNPGLSWYTQLLVRSNISASWPSQWTKTILKILLY